MPVQQGIPRAVAALQPQQAQPSPLDMWDQLIAAQQGRMEQPQAPMYSPQELAQRQQDNKDDYDLGMLGILSGNRVAGNAGEHVLKNAMAARQPRVTERGASNQITGKFTYSPEYLEERNQNTMTKLQTGRADAARQIQSDDRSDRREGRADRREDRADARMAAMAGAGGLGAGTVAQIGSDPQGGPIFRQKNGQLFTFDQTGQPQAYAGQVLPKASNSPPGEDERKAAGWYAQARNSWINMSNVMQADPEAAQVPLTEKLVGAIPRIGPDIANSMRSEGRQKFLQGASSLSEALLRAATGAGMNVYEAQQKVQELTPVYGEKPGTTKQKMAAIPMFLDSIKTRAGRALPAEVRNEPAMASPAGGGAGGLSPDEAAELAQLKQRLGR